MKKQSFTEKINNTDNKEIHLFAAANTSHGFVSFFEQVFCRDGMNKIYILKGGPGTGKSTIMKKYGEAAAKKGYTPIYYHCSSDPDSLDGVTVKETGISILDGTSPHVFDPVYPGVRDFYVNLSEAWNTDILAKRGDEIMTLADKKRDCYKSAYRLLEAAGSIEKEMYAASSAFVDHEKIKGFVRRFAHKYIRKTSQKEGITTTLVSAVSSKGYIRYFTFEKLADTVFFVRDSKLASRFLFKELAYTVKKSGVNAVFTATPENPDTVCGIYIPGLSISVSLYDTDIAEKLEKSGKTVKVINSARFIDAEIYKSVRQKYKFAEKCLESITAEALSELALAGEYHGELEKIYISATDYSIVNKLAESIEL